MADSPRPTDTVIQPENTRNQQFFNVLERPEVQQVQQLPEPNFGDMARNFLITTVPMVVVGIINTVRDIVGVVQSSLAAQQQQQSQANNQLNQNPGNETRTSQAQPQTPAPTVIRQNNNIQTVQSSSQVPVNTQDNNERQFTRGSSVGNTKMQTGPEVSSNPKMSVANNPQPPNPDVNQKKDLDAAVWLTARFGVENVNGQKTLQIGEHTCIYDPKNKNFEIKDSSQKTMLTLKDGKVQGSIPAELTTNIQRQQSAAITDIQRNSHQPQQQQSRGHVR
jgi:hypothetical protein